MVTATSGVSVTSDSVKGHPRQWSRHVQVGVVWIVGICVDCGDLCGLCVFFGGETELDMSRLGLEVGSMQCRTNLYNLISMRL